MSWAGKKSIKALIESLFPSGEQALSTHSLSPLARARLEARSGLLKAVGRLAGKSCGGLLETLLVLLLRPSIGLLALVVGGRGCLVLLLRHVLLQGLLACAFELGLPLFLSVLGSSGLI